MLACILPLRRLLNALVPVCVFPLPSPKRTKRNSKFRDWVPLPWLALVVFQTVEFGLAAYEVETEDVDELIQR